MTLGENIKTFRKAAGLTARQLGILCGYPEATAERTIRYWENDEREPSIKTLRLLSEALNVPIDRIVP